MDERILFLGLPAALAFLAAWLGALQGWSGASLQGRDPARGSAMGSLAWTWIGLTLAGGVGTGLAVGWGLLHASPGGRSSGVMSAEVAWFVLTGFGFVAGCGAGVACGALAALGASLGASRGARSAAFWAGLFSALGVVGAGAFLYR